MKKVLILGGGFYGCKQLLNCKSKQFEVTLLSDRDYLFIYPISIWIPVRTKAFDDVKVSLAKIQKKYPFNLVIDTVTKRFKQPKIKWFVKAGFSVMIIW